MLKVILPDGSSLQYSRRVRPLDIAAEIGPRLAKATLAAQVDGRLIGADQPLPEEGQISLRLITKKDPEALDIMRHSCAHVMARAVMRLFPGVQLAFGPTIENGFYYDFQLEHALSEEDFPRIEAEMAKIVKEDEAFERVEMDRREAIQLCRDLGQTLKVEHIEDGLKEEAAVSFYRQGEFIDLCRGRTFPARGRSGPSNSFPWPGRIGRAMPRAAIAADLRHGLVQPRGTRRIHPQSRRGQTPRPPGVGPAIGTFHDRSGRGFRAGFLAAQGSDHSPRTGKLHLRRTDQTPVSAGIYAGNRQCAFVRDLGPLSVL